MSDSSLFKDIVKEHFSYNFFDFIINECSVQCTSTEHVPFIAHSQFLNSVRE